MNKTVRIFMLGIAIVGIAVRLYKFSEPVADWHSWRQADTASVARIFVRDGVDMIRPRYGDLSNIPSGLDNPEGWRMVEFPIYQGIAAVIARQFPHVSLEIILRFVSILCSVGSAILLVLLIYPYYGSSVALFSGFLYAMLPYSVYYGRTILPEPMMVFLTLSSLVCLSRSRFILSVIFGSMAILVKPVAGFFLFPALYIIWQYKASLRKRIFLLFIFGVFSIIPLLFWRKWILQFPEGIPVFTWLFNEGNIRLKGAWWYWLFAERIAKLILGYWGTTPLILGLLVSGLKKSSLHWFMSLSVLAYFIVIARGNVQHDYYQIPILPVVCLLLGRGFVWMFHQTSNIWSMRIGALCIFLFMMAFSWYTIRTFYWINRPEIVEAGRAADALLSKNAKVIAPYNGDTTFLYQTGRSGWPLGFDIDKKISMGATAYVTVSPTDNDFETMELAKKYTVLVRNDMYAIIDLTRKNVP